MGKRSIRIEGETAYITLTKGYEAVLDAEDASLADGFNWSAMVQKNGIVYAKRSKRLENGKTTTIFLHRVIAGAAKGEEVDHRDHDGLNNKRSNLRVCKTSENQWNSRMQRTNTSGFKGVTWDKAKGKWKAQMRVNKKGKHIGHFNDPKEAGDAYEKACELYHGEFFYNEKSVASAP